MGHKLFSVWTLLSSAAPLLKKHKEHMVDPAKLRVSGVHSDQRDGKKTALSTVSNLTPSEGQRGEVESIPCPLYLLWWEHFSTRHNCGSYGPFSYLLVAKYKTMVLLALSVFLKGQDNDYQWLCDHTVKLLSLTTQVRKQHGHGDMRLGFNTIFSQKQAAN